MLASFGVSANIAAKSCGIDPKGKIKCHKDDQGRMVVRVNKVRFNDSQLKAWLDTMERSFGVPIEKPVEEKYTDYVFDLREIEK